MKQPNYNESTWSVLAFLRFILASIVLVGHLHVFTSLQPCLRDFSSLGGKSAVACFLLISGISIGYSYKTSQNGYFKRRFLRIYPLYFFAVLSAVLLQYYLGSPYKLPGEEMVAAGLSTSIINFFFLQGFASITITYNGPLWSLGVEIFFYAIVPLLFKLKNYAIYVIIFISLFTFSFLRFNLLYGYIALVWGWPWLIGFLISVRNKILLPVLLLVIGTFAIACNKEIMSEQLSLVTFLSVSTIVIMSILIHYNLSQKVKLVFNYLGELSYPLYLFHLPIFLFLFALGVRDAWQFLVLVVVLIIPINYVFDKFLKNVFWKPLILKLEQLLNRKSKITDIK